MATKKTTRKKPAAKRSSTKKRTTKNPVYKTFKVTNPDAPFFSVRITAQTVYWTILSLAVLAFGLWVIALQLQANSLYEDMQAEQTYITPVKK